MAFVGTGEGIEVESKEGLATAVSTSVPVVSVLEEKKSWLGVAKKHILTRQEFVVSEVDGQERVVVPKEVFTGAKPLWEDFLIGKFLNASAPHVGKIHMIVNKIWRLGDKSSLIDVLAVNDTTVKFRIRNEAMRTRILNRRMWNIMGIPMLISKWTPFAEEAQPAMKSIPLWVTLNNVPPSMFTDKGLEFLSSAVGKPIRLHPNTEACMSFEETQILVEADLTKDLPNAYHLMGEEEGELDAVIKYSYPWLPPRCSSCQKWGHGKNDCLAVVAGDTLVSPACPNLTKAKDMETEKVDKSLVSCQEKAQGNSLTVTEKPKEDKDMAEVEDGNMKEGETDAEWITPLKNSRSPGTKKEALKYGEVSLLSNSYSALSGKEEEEEETEAGNNSDAEQKDAPPDLENKEESESVIKKMETNQGPLERLDRSFHHVIHFPASKKILTNLYQPPLLNLPGIYLETRV